ncbi:AI-2E family transporter [Nakamurella sp. YIM 132087]|uniref:AI-2E family transporter n=1 Tax=Nakamurella alba TaxID=2665158 RepID=A0A7K1FLM6_9ACTN|nr:AI-2E family transporter [Nakamurella alba]MTD15006.1 AI-2E family transporter [Nakamurella alba]
MTASDGPAEPPSAEERSAGEKPSGSKRKKKEPESPATPVTEDPAAGERVSHAVAELSRWTLRILIIGAGLYVVLWLFGLFWEVMLPVLLALMLSTILWPPVRWMRRKLPHALAASIGVVAVPVVVGGLIALMSTLIASEWQGLSDKFSDGIDSLQTWLAGPPLNLGDDAVGQLLDKGLTWLQEHAQTLASSALTSLTTVGSLLVTLVLALVIAFFMLKDGPRFQPWVTRWVGFRAGRHFTELSTRIWDTLARYVWAQAAVAAIDGVFIGLGVWALGVPFALPIAVLTFFGGFIPIIGAFVAGFVAVLVALVANGFGTALAVLAIVLVVQQLEGNVISPMLMSRTMQIHAGVVLVAVTAGGGLFGIIGALLAVPAVSVIMVIAQYLRAEARGPDAPPESTIAIEAARGQPGDVQSKEKPA